MFSPGETTEAIDALGFCSKAEVLEVVGEEFRVSFTLFYDEWSRARYSKIRGISELPRTRSILLQKHVIAQFALVAIQLPSCKCAGTDLFFPIESSVSLLFSHAVNARIVSSS